MSIKKVAAMCQTAYKTVTQWTWLYRTGGAEKLLLSGRGGRYHNLLSQQAESDMLLSLQKKAEAGHIVTALSVKQAAEKILGHTVNKDYAYNVLHRNGWRKIMPHTYHPKGNKDAREALKNFPNILDSAKHELGLTDQNDCDVYFQDEGIFGRISNPAGCWSPKGFRPYLPLQRMRENDYVYTALCPKTGGLFSLILPESSNQCMQKLKRCGISVNFFRFFQKNPEKTVFFNFF